MKAQVKAKDKGLYERDFHLWTQQTAELLETGRLNEIDLEHLVEEVAEMGKRERRELESRLRVLLMHLIKWQTQPSRRGASWRNTIRLQRLEIRALLKDSPSLYGPAESSLNSIFGQAMELALEEMDMAELQTVGGPMHMDLHFKGRCPFSLEQVLNNDFLP